MKNRVKREISGIIQQDDLIVTFIGLDHHFVFLPASIGKSANEYGISGLRKGNIYGVLRPENNFLCGRTYDGKEVLIFCNHEIRLNPTYAFSTWLYIVSDVRNSVTEYAGIEFTGGSMNSVFYQDSLHIGTGKNPVMLSDDHRNISINSGNVRQFNIGSGIRASVETKKGNRIENTGVDFQLIFKETEDIRNTFQKNYNDIYTLIQFMTFRQDVWFEKVRLLEPVKAEGKDTYQSFAECYVLNDLDHEEEIAETDDELYENIRNYHRCITFDQLSDEETACLYQLISERESEQSQFVVNFIPESVKQYHYVTYQQIRDVCTSIEKEADILDINAENSEGFSEVMKSVKKVVKESRKSDHKLTDREYSYIGSNLQHWCAPAAELAFKLFDQNKDTVEPVMKKMRIEEIGIDDIQSVISLRNNLTHSGDSKAGKNDADVTLVLMAVVYSSILTRCGCNKELIREVFSNGLMTAAD